MIGVRNIHYILDAGGHPVEEPDVRTWAEWMETGERQVKVTLFGKVRVSTVFLGLDHNFAPDGPPVLFETLVFGGLLDGELDRYVTREEAEAGHEALCERVQEMEP